MKSYYSVVAAIFFVAIFNHYSFSQPQQVWYKTSDAPIANSIFNIYTGVDNGENVQFVLSGNATGLYISTDIGVNWVNIGLIGKALSSIYDNPDNSGEYVVSTSEGVYITSNGGTNWTQHNTGIEGLFITDVAKFFNSYIIGTATNGVYESTDGGLTFQQLGTGLENKFVSRVEIIYMAGEDDGIYAIIQGEGVYGLNIQSNTWVPINNGNPSLLNNTAITSNNQDKLFLTNFDNGVYSSPNDPVFWQNEINFPYANDIIGTQDDKVYAASLGNGVIERDLQGNWTDFSSGLPEINGYIDVVNIALDKPQISANAQHLWAAVNPLEPGGTPGIYRTVNPITDIQDNTIATPEDFRLEQNYPNPFNPSTTISYSVPSFAFVTIKVFDLLGNEIAELVNEEKPVGVHEVIFNASNLSTGTYFYQLQAVNTSTGSGQNFVETRKMILIK